MSSPVYDDKNPFAMILRGEIPAHKVYEDNDTVAFMDIMPRTDGHCLVIPKDPSRNLLDANPQTLAKVIATVQKVARAAMKAFNADGLQIDQYNEAPSGQTVFHLHFHVLPRYEGVALRPHAGQMADQTVLAEHAEKLRNELSKLTA